MALPVTIASVIVGQQNSFHGPVKSSGSAFYTALLDSTNNNLVELHKATDPTISFSEVDGANRPDFVADVLSLNIFQDSDNLHVAGQNSSDDVYYARAALGSDAWQDVSGGGAEEILVDGTPDGFAFACDIAVLSTAYGAGSAFVKIRVVYQGATDMDMGQEWERIDESNSVDDGVNWSAPTQIDNGASVAGVNYTGPRIVLPPSNSDQCHIFMGEQVVNNVTHRAIAGDDTLRAYRDTGFGTFGFAYSITHGIGFDRSGTSKVRIGYQESTAEGRDLGILEFNAFSDDTNPTETSSDVSTDDVQVTNSSVVACLAADGSVIRGLMVKVSDDDLYEFFDDDADSYTVEDTAHVAGTVNHISCNVYDRSGTKLAMIYDDGGTVKYDEIALVVVAPPTINLVMAPYIPA